MHQMPVDIQQALLAARRDDMAIPDLVEHRLRHEWARAPARRCMQAARTLAAMQAPRSSTGFESGRAACALEPAAAAALNQESEIIAPHRRFERSRQRDRITRVAAMHRRFARTGSNRTRGIGRRNRFPALDQSCHQGAFTHPVDLIADPGVLGELILRGLISSLPCRVAGVGTKAPCAGAIWCLRRAGIANCRGGGRRRLRGRYHRRGRRQRGDGRLNGPGKPCLDGTHRRRGIGSGPGMLAHRSRCVGHQADADHQRPRLRLGLVCLRRANENRRGVRGDRNQASGDERGVRSTSDAPAIATLHRYCVTPSMTRGALVRLGFAPI